MLKKLFNRFSLELDSHKSEETASEIKNIKISPILTYPLWQKHGQFLNPCVKVGDTVFAGQLIAVNKKSQTAIYAGSSGLISEIDKPMPVIDNNQVLVPSIIIQTDDKHQWQTQDISQNYLELSKTEILSRLQAAGLVGLGGAAFPSLKKINDSEIDTLIINAVECEPHINCDSALMLNKTLEIIQGTLAFNKVLQAKRIIIAIEDNKPLAIDTLKNNTKDLPVEIITVPTQYPNGAAHLLIEQVTGIKIPQGKHSNDLGVVCYNVATMYAAYEAIALQRPLTQRITTIAGSAVKKSFNINLILGTPIYFLLEQLGLDLTKDYAISQGGNMMALTIHDTKVSIQAQTNCLLINKDFLQEHKNTKPCINCGRCSDLCPINLQPQVLYRLAHAEKLTTAKDNNINSCIECGLCDAVCPSYLPLASSLSVAKKLIKQEAIKKQEQIAAKIRYENRTIRLEKIAEQRRQKRAEKQAKLKQQRAESPIKNNDKKAAIMAAVARAKRKKIQES